MELLASFIVGTSRKDLLVIGDRAAHYRPRSLPVFTEPVPFTAMPMRYELAYGGVDVRSDPTLAFPTLETILGAAS